MNNRKIMHILRYVGYALFFGPDSICYMLLLIKRTTQKNSNAQFLIKNQNSKTQEIVAAKATHYKP